MTGITIVILTGILALSCAARFIRLVILRQLLLLSISYWAYAHWAGTPFLLLLIASSLVNYFWGSVLRRRPTTALLWVGIGLNVFLLGFFKYVPAMIAEWPEAASAGFLRDIILPLGISFWTFQGISYLFDLYREEELDPSLLEFCLYIAFWPTVASGPVARLPNMLPQFRQTSTAVGDDFSVGAVRIVQGIFMKFVLAHLLNVGLSPGGGVSAGFDEVAPARSGLDVWALAIGYGFQIFFDFAGYTNIVVGAARLIGIQLPENFNRPYLSTTPSIFWTRWHMSLSFWIRDYVFMPLAILRRDPWWPYVAVIISMVTFGFWHGPKLTFIAWGFYNGLLLVGHRMGQKLKKRISIKLPHPAGILFSWASTFLLISLGYIFFRANNLTQALQLWRAVLTPGSYYVTTLSHDYYLLVGLVLSGYFASAGIAQIVNLWGCYTEQWRIRIEQAPPPTVDRWVSVGGALVMTENLLVSKKWWLLTPILVLISIVTTLSFFGQSSSIAPFIYARF